MAIDLTKKSNRTLLGKRYTTDAFTDGQDAFTSVFDINSGEIYTQANFIPSASLPFSGSSQNSYYFTTGSTVSATPTGNDVMRFWYRHALTKSDLSVIGKEVWMFISGSTSISTGAQLINANQQTNFISPKYSIPGISTNTAEANPAGYVIKAIYSNDNLGTTADIDSSYYNFDYKTGIFQFTSSAIATTVIADATNGRVYLTAYQYVGQALSTRLTNVDSSLAALSASIQAVSSSGAVAGGSNGQIQYNNSSAFGGVPTLVYSGGTLRATGSFTGSFYGDGSQLTGIATTLAVTSSAGNVSVNLASQALTIQGTSNEVEVSGSGQTITIGLPDNVTIGNDLTVSGNLTVQGTTVTLNTTNVAIEDQFILLASGSSSTIDGGIIVQNAANAGEALYWENNPATTGRWAISSSVSPTATSLTAAEYLVTAEKSAGGPPANPTYGGTTNGFGNLHIDSNTGDVYIYT
jgi:hypothetical protein